MRGGIPPLPTGSGPFASWAQWVHGKLTREFRFLDSSTVKVSSTTRGIIFKAAAQKGGGTSTPSTKGLLLFPYAFFGIYIVCNTKSDATGTMYRVAMPCDLWNTILSNTIDGNLWNYTYPFNPANWQTAGPYVNPSAKAFVRRTASFTNVNGTVTENQAITPRYISNRPIVCLPNITTGLVTILADNINDPSTGTHPFPGTAITWQHCGPHHWSRLSNQNA